LDKGSYNNVVALYRSNESTSVGEMYLSSRTYTYFKQITGPFDAELVAKLPPSLKYICHNGAGYDNIDVEACSSRGKIPMTSGLREGD
jgi:D-3-phosphoglycerate dehydrogenase